MAGHSQFKNIMHRKGAADAVRSKVFSKLAREITVAAKLGLPDPDMNPRLRAAILAARGREHAEGQHRARHQEGGRRRGRELRGDPLRGLRPGRRGADRRGADRQPQPHRLRRPLLLHQERRQPGRDRRGLLHVRPGRPGRVRRRRRPTPTPMLEAAIEAGADDVASTEDGHEIYLRAVATRRGARRRWRRSFGEPEGRQADLAAADRRRRSTTRPARSCCKLLETLEDHDDVQNVYGNFEVSDAVMADRCAELGWPAARVRILGLDPGLRNTGWGVIDDRGPQAVLPGLRRGHLGWRSRPGAAAEAAPRPARRGRRGPGRRTRRRSRRPSSTRTRRRTLKLGQARGDVAAGPGARRACRSPNTAPTRSRRRWSASGTPRRSRCSPWCRCCCRRPTRRSADAADALADRHRPCPPPQGPRFGGGL